MIPIDDTPEHEELCERQAARLYDAITTNTDLTSHLHDAVESLRIVRATIAPEKLLSARDGRSAQR